jgi:N utilization substance protein B
MLFQLDLTGAEPGQIAASFWSGVDAPEAVRRFAERLVAGVHDARGEIDEWIVGAAENWRIERMPVVDRNVLRIAIWEMLHEEDTPRAVVIDEAIEIAKRFGGGESGRFVNGVLDTVRRKLGDRDRAAGSPS